MMKWIFGTLVLANIGIWMWAQWYREPTIEIAFQARPDVAAEKMKLLSESAKQSKPVKSETSARADNNAGTKACFRVGPFLDPSQATTVAEKLTALKLSFSRDAGERKAVTGYRVQLPPLESKTAAERKRRELTRLGFKDHALITEPGFENAISLGVFSVEPNAKAQTARLSAKGITASIVPVETSRMEIWFDITGAPTDADRTIAKELDAELRSVQGAVANSDCTARGQSAAQN